MEENKKDELLAQGGEASESVTQADGTSDTVQRAGTLEGAQDAASENTQNGASENTQGSEIPVTTQEQDTCEAQIPETGTSNDICRNCGAPWLPGQTACPNCGAPKADPAPVSEASADATAPTCPNCGTLLQEGQKFCPGCGQMLGAADPAGSFNTGNPMNPMNPANPMNPENPMNPANPMNPTAMPYGAPGIPKRKSKALPLVIVAVVVVLIAALATLVLVSSDTFASVATLCARGNYAKAYEKASEEEKPAVKGESVAAECSAFAVDNLKDPSSFKLREVYYSESTNDDGEFSGQIVLYISGANSYGASVSSYWLFTWDDDDNEWSYFCSVSDLEQEEYSDYDDEDEKWEKIVNNFGRGLIGLVKGNGIELDKSAVKRINTLFERDMLDDVTAIYFNN